MLFKHEWGFEITFPESWVVTKNPDAETALSGTSALAIGAQGSACLRVCALTVSKDATAKDCALHQIRITRDAVKQFELNQFDEVRIADLIAYKFAYQFNWAIEMPRIKSVDYFLVARGSCYMILSTAASADYGIYTEEINAIANSFKL